MSEPFEYSTFPLFNLDCIMNPHLQNSAPSFFPVAEKSQTRNSVSTPLQQSPLHHPNIRSFPPCHSFPRLRAYSSRSCSAATPLSDATPTPLTGSNVSPVFPPDFAFPQPHNVSPIREHGMPPLMPQNPPLLVDNSQHHSSMCDLPRPQFNTFQSQSELAHQLLPLSCVFKKSWVDTCERWPKTGDIISLIRQCLHSDKVARKKPQELAAIMGTAKLDDGQQGKVLDFRRKIMRQKTRKGKVHVAE